MPYLEVSPLWWVTGPLLVVLIGLISVVAIRPAPYVALVPGQARAVEPVITLKKKAGGPTPIDEKPTDDLLFLTVSLRRPSGAETVWRTFDDTAQVLPERVIDGTQSEEENRQFNLQLMSGSKEKATTVALQRTGYDVKVETSGAVVTDLDPSYPVAKVLDPGDTVVEADGEAIETSDDLVAVIALHQPGDDLALRVVSFTTGETRSVVARLRENPAKAGKAQLGVSLEDRPKFTFPIDVQIESGDIGGPSAGLAFTLALIDRLTPGSLTGGTKVAVTGTIELDGSVGNVGGVPQKTEAAIEQGATLFLVPADEVADARKAAKGRLTVRKVATVDEALAVLEDQGGDPVPAVPKSGG